MYARSCVSGTAGMDTGEKSGVRGAFLEDEMSEAF